MAEAVAVVAAVVADDGLGGYDAGVVAVDEKLFDIAQACLRGYCCYWEE